MRPAKIRRLWAGVALGATLATLACGAALSAHEIGTTRVSVVFRDARTYDIEIVTDAGALVEKLQAASGRPAAPGAHPELPALLTRLDEPFRQRVQVAFDGVAVEPSIRFSVERGPDALASSAATIQLTGAIPPNARSFVWRYGWTFASYALTVRNTTSENPATEWLEGGQPSAPVALASAPRSADRLHTAWRYLVLGFTHIVPNGLDHILFVLGIYLLTHRPRAVLCQVSAFTIAHSITLGLSLYGLVTISPRVVEPMIAVSIAYVAIENIFLSELKSWRVALVFAFGLLHGLGFAGALKELALAPSEFLIALLTFNLGVEMGQLTVIVGAFLLVGWYGSRHAWYRSRIAVPASVLIACTAIYWTIERL